MRGLVASGLLLVGASLGSWRELPAKIESWLFNPRERTERGLEAEVAETAAEAFDAAARLAPDDPVARFNAGTGRLLAERPDAIEELQQAATLAPPELQPRTLYNMGNAQLAADDPAAAVEAYKTSLRIDPDQPDAKHNLELALRLLEQQNSGQGEDQETPDGENQGEQEQSPAGGREDPQEDPRQQEGEQDPQQQGEEGREQPQDSERERPLPNFDEQEDMSAEQAAAILEAVENLEREQRREQAAERLKTRRSGDRDW